MYTDYKESPKYWKFLEFLMFPVAVAFAIFLIYKYLLQISLPIFSQITQICLFYFAILNIVKIAFHKGNLDYIKKIVVDLTAVIVCFLLSEHPLIFQFYVILRQAVIFSDKLATSQPAVNIFSRFRNHPAKVILISFAFVILLGSAFLSLPIASSDGESIGLIDAAFTATSATCVTGLIVLNTGTAFSLFGKIIIFLLMQIGGLGIMTFSTMLIMLLGRRLSLGPQSLMQGVLGEAGQVNMTKLIKAILITTFSFEIIGTALLFIKFHTVIPDIKTAVGYSIFHSVSAFCNAGFCLYSDSFTQFQNNLLVNIVMITLIICGGIGFGVLLDIKNNIFKRKQNRVFSLHSKIVISSTIFLIVVGAILIFLFEYKNQFQNLPLKNGLMASVFQSVTTRTAGFNTMNIGKIGYATSLLMMVLMFIGASPGSTGGGIKTTSFAVLILSVWSIIKGREEVEVCNRTISQKVTKKVISLVAIALTILIGLILVLCLSEKFPFEKIVFEAFSAFGTVGLSMGLTPNLTVIGRIAIMLLMYFGRVGPLTIAFAISEKKIKTYYHYPEEDIAIG